MLRSGSDCSYRTGQWSSCCICLWKQPWWRTRTSRMTVSLAPASVTFPVCSLPKVSLEMVLWFRSANWRAISVSIGGSLPSAKLPLRIVAGVWCLAAIILSNSFKGHLVSFLTVPKFEPVLNTYEDVAASTSKNMIVWKATYLHDLLVVWYSSFPTIKMVMKTLRRIQPPVYSLSWETLWRSILN